MNEGDDTHPPSPFRLRRDRSEHGTWGTLANKLSEIESPDPFAMRSSTNPDFVEYRLDDDDKNGIMCLTFQRNGDELIVKLAAVMNPDPLHCGTPFSFSIREVGAMGGGGSLPMVRNAALCLLAALLEERQ